MAIVLWHSQTGYFFPPRAFAPFYLAGAVPVFFVLSGLVLTIGFDKYHSRSDFFVARIARVWPAHMAALVWLFLVFYPYSLDFFYHTETVLRLVVNVLLLQAWSPNVATYWSYNAPSWSVSCKLFAYAAFPLAFAVLRRQTLARAVTIVAVIFCAIVAVDELHPGVDASWLGGVNPISCFGAFAVGIATGVWRRKLPPPRRIRRGHGYSGRRARAGIGCERFFCVVSNHHHARDRRVPSPFWRDSLLCRSSPCACPIRWDDIARPVLSRHRLWRRNQLLDLFVPPDIHSVALGRTANFLFGTDLVPIRRPPGHDTYYRRGGAPLDRTTGKAMDTRRVETPDIEDGNGGITGFTLKKDRAGKRTEREKGQSGNPGGRPKRDEKIRDHSVGIQRAATLAEFRRNTRVRDRVHPELTKRQ